MIYRFIRWLIVVIIAAAIVLAIRHLTAPEQLADVGAPLKGHPWSMVQNEEIPAIPWAPSCQASGMSSRDRPPIA